MTRPNSIPVLNDGELAGKMTCMNDKVSEMPNEPNQNKSTDTQSGRQGEEQVTRTVESESDEIAANQAMGRVTSAADDAAENRVTTSISDE